MAIQLAETKSTFSSSPSKLPASLDHFFSAAEVRIQQWHVLHRLTQAATGGNGISANLKNKARATFESLLPIESYFAYPGPDLLASLNEALRDGDLGSFSRSVRKINNALVSGQYRHDQTAWRLNQNTDSVIGDVLPPAAATGTKQRPYFELLIVTAAEHSTWSTIREGLRKLSRPEDQFVYEPVIVGNFEDAVLSTALNGNIQAVVIYDGFSFSSPNDLPLLDRVLAQFVDEDTREDRSFDSASSLAQVIKEIRPELDLYLLSEGEVEKIAACKDADNFRRVFYSIEELLEVHLTVLDGVSKRYRTPYFDNLKKYAQRPIGTFHALPVARGKSIFKSNWIRDMGEFYGTSLFLAESSATTGGLDSLLEPTGNIKLAQESAARAFGGDRSFFVTNGTSTANKIVMQALVKPGDIVLIDRDCHKSHHYGLVLAGAFPYYIDAYPLSQYSMYGGVPIRRIKEALFKLKAQGKLNRVRLLVLTNSTFDGHLADVRRTMEECLAIKPDLIFLWDEAWSAFAHFSPFLRRRTAMDGAATLRATLKDPQYQVRYADFKKEVKDLDPANTKLLDARLYPDPEKTRVRVYQTTSVHKSMSALRQGSIIVVADDDFARVEEPFHEAFFTHTSTSPNLQIIASLDVARRQMELEGYELVMRSLQLALELRMEINSHPLISKYFKALSPADLIPAEYRQSGISDYGPPHSDWTDALRAVKEDEFFLDPTRITLFCGNAGFDGTQFKSILSERFDIQLNKTSRNSVLLQININNTRSDLAHIIKALANISQELDHTLSTGGEGVRADYQARIDSLVKNVPDLPNFSAFHEAFHESNNGAAVEGNMRAAFYTAYDEQACEHIKLASEVIDERLEKGPALVSANFVIPYPPGFPIMVPGQLITKEIVTFMRKLDVKEIHGYTASLGLKLIKSEALNGRSDTHTKKEK